MHYKLDATLLKTTSVLSTQ